MDIIDLQTTPFDESFFLKNYWQKKPLLLKHFMPSFSDPFSADELAGFACEEELESRLIIEGPTQDWRVENGPFEIDRLSKLPKSNWSLLLQSLDHWSPEIHSLLDSFNFLPAHILDDIMVSYSPSGGSVGPHFDYYDVFLIQGSGRKEWKTGQYCDENSERLKDCELSILKSFETKDCFTLENGDVLYLPANIAHWGVALDPCTTYSVGFRTPSLSQCVSHLADDTLENLKEHQRIQFPELTRANNAELNNKTIQSIKTQIAENLLNDSNLLNWYGKFASAPKNDSVSPAETTWTIESLDIALQDEDLNILRNEGSRFLHAQEAEVIHLFVDGMQFSLPNTPEHQKAFEFSCYQNEICRENIYSLFNSIELKNILIKILNNGGWYIDQ